MFECDNYGEYATSKCPKYFKDLGNFLCEYECPDGFVDNDIYCMPELIKRT